MQVEKKPFPVSTIDLQNSKVLIRPEQAEAAKGKNVVIDENALSPPMRRFCHEKWW
jgi:hypothetical protein